MLTLPLLPALCATLALATGAAAPPLPVVVSLPPQVWLVESIGGPRVAVEALVGPGQSEETYAPTDAQVTALLRARAYFSIGVSFEQAPWFRALGAARELEVVDTRAGVELLPHDPHIWLSPRRLAVQARTVAATLARLDPPGRAVYERRLNEVTSELDSLDREVAAMLAPHRGRAFFVFHPSWAYFAADYGLRQVAIESEGAAPTDRELTRLQQRARAEAIRTLFVQPQITGRAAEAVATTVGAAVVRLDPLALDVPGNLRLVAQRLIESFATP